MFKSVESMTSLLSSVVRRLSDSASRRTEIRGLADKLEEFVRRVRRAGLLFIVIVSGLLVVGLAIHPIGLLLWLIALPLVAFASLLSMLWPSRHFLARKSVEPALPELVASTLRRLVRSRGEIPFASRAAFDCVIRQVKAIEGLGDGHDTLLLEETKRLIGRHLPRLVESFLALPAGERTDVRADALTNGLGAIAEELTDLSERLLASRTDRFEIERQFIANRFPRRSGLAGI